MVQYAESASMGDLVLKMENLVTGEVWTLETKDPITEVQIDTFPNYDRRSCGCGSTETCGMCFYVQDVPILDHTLIIKAKMPVTPGGVAYTMTTTKPVKEVPTNMNNYESCTDRTPFVDRVPGYYKMELDRRNVEEVAVFLGATSWKVDLKLDDPTSRRQVTFYGVKEQKGKKFVVVEGEIIVRNDDFADTRNYRVFTPFEFHAQFDQKANPRG